MKTRIRNKVLALSPLASNRILDIDLFQITVLFYGAVLGVRRQVNGDLIICDANVALQCDLDQITDDELDAARSIVQGRNCLESTMADVEALKATTRVRGLDNVG